MARTGKKKNTCMENKIKRARAEFVVKRFKTMLN